MKKLRIYSVILLVISAAAYFGFQVYSNVTRDNTPPVVCDREYAGIDVYLSDYLIYLKKKCRKKRWKTSIILCVMC